MTFRPRKHLGPASGTADRPRPDERGFTIVEVMIAMSLLALVMTALAPAFYAALTAATSANHRTAANGVAVASIEAMRAVSYDDLGFYGDQTTPSRCSGQTNPVVLGSTSPSGGALILPTTSQTVGPVSYTVNRCIDWVNADNATTAGQPYANAYKQTTAYVSWTDKAGSHTITFQSTVYPGGQGPVGSGTSSSTSTTSTTIACTPTAPTGAATTDQGSPADQSAIGVSWQAPSGQPTPTYYLVEYNTTGTFTDSTAYATSPPIYATNTVIGSLTAGSLYYFNIVSVACGGTLSISGAQTSGSTAVSTTTTTTTPGTTTTTVRSTTTTTLPCAVSGITVTPSNAVLTKKNILMNGNSAGGFTVTVNAASNCAAVTVTYTTSGHTATQVSLTGSGGQLTGSAGTSSTTWDPGNDAFTVYVNGIQYSPVVQRQVNMCVENGNSGKC